MFRLPIFCVLVFSTALLQSLVGQEKITYEEHVKPIFRQHCLKCHGNDKQKAGINLQSFGDAMKGGSGGEILIAGRSSQSLLYQSLIDEDDDLRMPPNKPPIPADQIEMVRKWIDTGMLETASSKAMAEVRDLSFQPTGDVASKPDVPVMPSNLPTVKVRETSRPLPVLALDTSPWAPLVAVAGQEHIRLLNTETEQEIGKLPFPEGVPHVIRFSRNGAVLLVAGGRPVKNGLVVLFDVKTGKRLAEIGDELDVVLAADLSPDQELVALGGSGKIVKVYSTKTGEELYQLTKHTDWITTLAFSPDGKQLATGDRVGAIHLWDAKQGGLMLNLAEHKSAITSLDWRSDSKFLASAGEDGRIVWWEAKDGFPAINKAKDHPTPRPPGVKYGEMPSGVLAARFGPKGNLATGGRNSVVHLYDAKGNALKKYRVDGDIPLSIAVTHDTKHFVAGYLSGLVKFWRAE
tara:strand:- start:5215 stop:6600 length:1386 start_codon:yes stop_codon:yes gene_type:complete